MDGRSEGIGELLLSRLPQPANLGAYQQQVASLLAKNEKKLQQHKWTVRRIWIFVILLSAPCLWLAGAHFSTPQGNWFLGAVFFWVLFGAVEIAKYENNQARVEVLRELKQVQLQILELHASVGKGAAVSGAASE